MPVAERYQQREQQMVGFPGWQASYTPGVSDQLVVKTEISDVFKKAFEEPSVRVRQEMAVTPCGFLYHGTHIAPAEMSISPRGEYAVGKNGEVRERKYDAFIQLMIKRGNKIAAVSFPLPLGVTAEMGQEILRKTLYLDEDHAPARTFGEKKELRAMVRMGISDNLLERFVTATEEVINEQHPRQGHKAVQKFYRDQLIRQYYLGHTQAQVDAILANPNFLHLSAWREENKGKRIFVMEHYFDSKKGKLIGIGPAPDYKVFEIENLAADMCHKNWLAFYNEFGGLEGDWVLGHVDGGPTVDGGGPDGDGCGGSKYCADYFDAMEDPIERLVAQSTEVKVERVSDPKLWRQHKEELTCDACGETFSGKHSCKLSEGVD